MSDTKTYKGKLTPVRKGRAWGETLEQQCKKLNIDIDNLVNHIVVGDKLFKIKAKCHDHENIYMSNKNVDGSIDFLVQYYNGSEDLSEAIEQAVIG